jgi:hypothetical protein
MVKSNTIYFLIFSTLVMFCKNVGLSTNPPSQPKEYVIEPTDPTSLDSNAWFKVINITSNEFKTVPAVIETTGGYYLPVMNMPPLFNNKVVEGVFLQDTSTGNDVNKDTIFKVTHLIRDTALGFYR